MTKSLSSEKDIRIDIMNSILRCPHRDLDKIQSIHDEMRKKDPVFYAHLGSWYFKNGEIRDHKQAFSSNLIVDDFLDNREVGLAMLRLFPVFLKRKVIAFIKGHKVKMKTKTGKILKIGNKAIEEVKIDTKVIGMFKNLPSSVKTEISGYLRNLESDNDWFDSVLMNNYKDLRTLYALAQLKPSLRAKILLDYKLTPEEAEKKKDIVRSSKKRVFKDVLKASSNQEKAELIVKNKIPYKVAVGLVDQISPSVLIALVDAMTPQEVINNLASLEERGALENEVTSKIINGKLEAARIGNQAQTLKGKVAADSGRVKNEKAREKLLEIADTQLKKKASIDFPIAVLIDRSGSMQYAIEVGKKVAVTLSASSSAKVHAIAFDTIASEIVPASNSLSDWEKAFSPIRAGGGTSIGSALYYMLKKKISVEQILIVTDEEENGSPLFKDVYKNYCTEMGVYPFVNIINIGSKEATISLFQKGLKAENIDFQQYVPNGADYTSLPGLIQFLRRSSREELMFEISEYPLMARTSKVAAKIPKATETPKVVDKVLKAPRKTRKKATKV
jgi:hypothetical protein